MTLSDLAIKRPVFTTMTSVGIIVLGVMGYFRLPVDLFPDVQFPVIVVSTVYPGASPGEVEQQVTKPLEDAVISLNGIKQLQSFSRDSVSQIVVQFALDVDVQQAATEVRERVAQARATLPRDVEEPTIGRVDIAAAPIMTYVLSGERDVQALRDVAEDVIKPRLEQVDGVARIQVRGGRERQLNVELDLPRIEALGLTPIAVADKIRAENLSVPGGDFREGGRSLSVRTIGEVRSVGELRELPIAVGPTGSMVRLGDVARVVDGFADDDTQVRSNADAAVVFEVLKASGENTVEVARNVQERLAELALPEGVRAQPIIDQSEFILENAHEVEVALFFGGAMAILVILLFLLDFRSTFISGLALPTSVIGAFFLMWWLDFTLNMMTLLGLSLAIGLLIDDSIVVRENIMKHLERGTEPVLAAQRGTREITLAVLATTATLCAVFVPVAFTGGIIGQFFREFGLTVAGATILSAWVALTLDPMLSARLAKQHVPGAPHSDGPFGFLVRPMRRFYEGLDAVYAAILRWVLRGKLHMAAMAVLAIGTLFGSCALVPLMGSEFTAPEDRGQYMVDIELPAGTSPEETGRLSLLAEQQLTHDPRYVNVYATTAPNGDPNVARWRVTTVPKWDRRETFSEMMEHTREVIRAAIPGAEISITPPSIVDGARDYPIALYVQGDSLDDIAVAAHRVAELLRGIPGTKDVDVRFTPGLPEVRAEIDRERAARLGVPAALLARTVRASLEGEVAGLYRDGDDELDIRVRLAPEYRASAEQIARVPVATPGGLVPLSDLVTLTRGSGPQVIERSDRRRLIMVTASPDGRPLGDVVSELEAQLARETFAPGVTWSMEGTAKMMAESNESMLLALLLGVVFIYIVLASQFESFIHPVTIMMALPMAVVGALIALFLQGSSLSMGAMIGIILLMGLVTKNGILLVDHAVQRVNEGMTPHDAILDAGPSRLRPILMTSAAMVLGMLPTALGQGSGSEFRAPMAMGVIGGVISSTFLTLIVVPVFYLAVEGLRRFVRSLFGASKSPKIARAEPIAGAPREADAE